MAEKGLESQQTLPVQGGIPEDVDLQQKEIGGVQRTTASSSTTLNVSPQRYTTEDAPSDVEEEYEVAFDGPDDKFNPKNLPKLRKWLITVILSLGSLCCTCTSSIYTSTYEQTTREFNSPQIILVIGLSLFVLGLGIGPMVLAPLSEFYGRRIIYIASFVFFTIFLIPSAVAKNVETMLVARFFDGVAGSAFLSVAGGTVADMFERTELGAPMMIFTCAPFVGPTLGPLIGGFINQNTNWRWTYYVMLIWSAIMLALCILFVCETYPPVMLQRKARHLSKESGKCYYAQLDRLDRSITRTIAISCLRPFQLLFLEPMCSLLCLFTALLLGILYLFFQAFPRCFGGTYNFSLQQVGLSFLGIFVGMLTGSCSDPIWKRRYSKLVASRNAKGLEAKPEYRLPAAVVGGAIVPVGLFIFAFTQRAEIHWIVPIIGSGIFALGVVLVYSGVFTFLVEAYPLYAASALAANSFSRSCFAAGFPLFSGAMYDKLGNQWASGLIAFISLAMAPLPLIFFKYGEKLRARSRYAVVKPAATASGQGSKAELPRDSEKQEQ